MFTYDAASKTLSFTGKLTELEFHESKTTEGNMVHNVNQTVATLPDGRHVKVMLNIIIITPKPGSTKSAGTKIKI